MKDKYCRNCGLEITEGWKHCPNCGALFEKMPDAGVNFVQIKPVQTKAAPSIGKSILFSVMCFIGFYICYFIVVAILGLITSFFASVPVLNLIARLFYSVRGDSPTFLLPALGAALGYAFISWLIGRVTDDTPTASLSFEIFGVCLAALNLFLLIVNIIEKSGWGTCLTNIIMIVTGVSSFFRGLKAT